MKSLKQATDFRTLEFSFMYIQLKSNLCKYLCFMFFLTRWVTDVRSPFAVGGCQGVSMQSLMYSKQSLTGCYEVARVLNGFQVFFLSKSKMPSNNMFCSPDMAQVLPSIRGQGIFLPVWSAAKTISRTSSLKRSHYLKCYWLLLKQFEINYTQKFNSKT